MRKIKYIFLVLTICLVTGCSVEYDLTIEKKAINEKVTFIYSNNEENKNSINELSKQSSAAFYNPSTKKTGYYDISTSEDSNNLYLKYKYKYTDNDFKYSNIINQCYYKKNIINGDNYIIIKTEGTFSCLYDDYEQVIDDVVIKIKTNLKVVENNADEVRFNQYIWKIDKDNYNDKPIYIKIDKNKKSILAFIIQFMQPVIIIGSIVLVVGLVIGVFHVKSKKANKL